MGINSIYGALQILYIAEQENKKVFLHCHAGKNRSPMVQECYHFLRTGTHLKKDRHRIAENIQCGHLPCIKSVERFLKQCGKTFELQDSYRGGQLDAVRQKSQIY